MHTPWRSFLGTAVRGEGPAREEPGEPVTSLPESASSSLPAQPPRALHPCMDQEDSGVVRGALASPGVGAAKTAPQEDGVMLGLSALSLGGLFHQGPQAGQ